MNARVLRSIRLKGDMPDEMDEHEPDMMSDARYIRQSSVIIHEALQKGFDVLQLANGEIVTTGTKVVVYRYRWDAAKGRIVRIKTTEDEMLDETAVQESA